MNERVELIANKLMRESGCDDYVVKKITEHDYVVCLGFDGVTETMYHVNDERETFRELL